MTDHPIIFSAPMVRALLDGRKTQTRRLATSPLAKIAPGDRLWVRENFQLLSFGDYAVTRAQPCDFRYAATDRLADADRDVRGYPWRPSIHMPRWASRITLTVEAVHAQQLQEISEADAIAEGCPCQTPEELAGMEARGWFCDLWESLHGVDAWAANPAVVAITFSVHRGNIDDAPQPAAQAA